MPSTLCFRLLFILIMLPVSGFAQEKYLALDKPGRVKRIRFYAGDEIALKLKGDKRLHEEVIGDIGDSTITLLGTEIPLRDIRAIVIRHEGGLVQQAVRKLPIAGVLYFLAATFNPLLQDQPLAVKPVRADSRWGNGSRGTTAQTPAQADLPDQ